MKMARQIQENLFSWSCIAIFGGGRDARLAADRSCAAADSPEGRGCGRDVRRSDISAKIRFREGTTMQTQSIKDQVYQGILNDILDGVYDVTSVIREKDMIEKYHVSKTPVREALVQLCGENILRNIPRYGYQVVAITPQQIREAVEYRKVIELGALAASFPVLTEKNLSELEKLNDEVQEIESIHDYKIHWKCNLEFHRKLCSFCGNSYLQKALEEALRLCTGISNQYYTKSWEGGREERAGNHERIVQALREKDLETAKEILARDLDAFREELL